MRQLQHLGITIALSTTLLLGSACSRAQDVANPDSILIGNAELPQVLLVGSFHFEYYDPDAHVTAKERRVNVKDPRRQKELEELVDHIARFKPTAIAIECGPNTGNILRRYERARASGTIDHADEIDQIGFRVMERFGIDTLYGVDAPTLVEDLWSHRDSSVLHPLVDSVYADWDFTSDDETSRRYKAYYTAMETYRSEHTLIESFKMMNSDKAIDRDFGAYLAGDFKLGKYRGADGLAMHWYARNLRIFRNIQELHLGPDDRLLVLFGAGHMGVLKHLFECSTEFSPVRFVDL